ncbi:alpha/beta hydrolase fold protein [Mycolicibacterium canariasense]|uniref:Alpha/beta hydrolase fold protein n=1 Tax=Mycolicibacterium canariasense TaxID=228230 RepID=A0A117IBJ7_MYCCR|nr:alpha/beta hydrolase [Mycolicibacterium canariasense]MCV7212415.1 alpha/beta hydrolase [Mycolicibacterium canariasense]ORV15520.1 alpha/beta hydrolase [Mycolicibacterium canariasense]GAS98012.1 alpha/beta hydrolase fold protein [Mycolicibacterium canariasense]
MTDRYCLLPGGNRVCYRVDGGPTGQPLVLIAGLTLDLTSWPAEMVDGLTGLGFRVIRLDNRDVGQSTWATTAPPGRLRQLTRRPRADGYDLGDMAGDVVALLDHLDIDRVHLVGMSMGGMIAQTVAARYPDRVLTLTSIFSTTGAPDVGQPAFSTLALLARRAPRTKQTFIDRHITMMKHLAGTGFPLDVEAAADYAGGAWDRGPGPCAGAGVARQINAIFKSGDRTAELARITAPTQVVHGDRDRIVHPSGGAATAAAIPAARHLTIPGMGHDLAPGLIGRLVAVISQNAARAESAELQQGGHPAQ